MGRKKLYHSEEERKEANKNNRKKWFDGNKEIAKDIQRLASKKWNELNKDKNKEYNKNWFLNNSNYQKEYRLKNIDKIKIKRNIKEIERKKNDKIYKLSCDVSRMFRQVFHRNNYTKNSRSHEILGCSYELFKEYIESKFESWMTWENKGLYNGKINYGWDIDHILPISTAKTEEDIIKLNHYSNLQPLCSKVNRDIKKDKCIDKKGY